MCDEKQSCYVILDLIVLNGDNQILNISAVQSSCQYFVYPEIQMLICTCIYIYKHTLTLMSEAVNAASVA